MKKINTQNIILKLKNKHEKVLITNNNNFFKKVPLKDQDANI